MSWFFHFHSHTIYFSWWLGCTHSFFCEVLYPWNGSGEHCCSPSLVCFFFSIFWAIHCNFLGYFHLYIIFFCQIVEFFAYWLKDSTYTCSLGFNVLCYRILHTSLQFYDTFPMFVHIPGTSCTLSVFSIIRRLYFSLVLQVCLGILVVIFFKVTKRGLHVRFLVFIQVALGMSDRLNSFFS